MNSATLAPVMFDGKWLFAVKLRTTRTQATRTAPAIEHSSWIVFTTVGPIDCPTIEDARRLAAEFGAKLCL